MSLETKRFEFEGFVLDADEKVLLWQGKPVQITPKIFQLLFVLVKNHDHIVEKEKLMDEVWADSFVEESNLTYSIRQLRKILGDDKQHPRFIETIPRRGYRFITPVSISEANARSHNWTDATPNSSKGILTNFFSRPVFYSVAFLTIASVALTAGLMVFRGTFWVTNQRTHFNAAFNNLRFDPIAKFDTFSSASISPDGKYAAYINTVNQKQSIWLRQLSTGQATQIVPAEEGVRIMLLEFAGDGESLYFSRKSENLPAHVDRVPVFGGIIDTNIVSGLETEFGVSPDQNLISFHRSQDQKTSLFLARADRTEIKPLFETDQSITGNTFSPDGKKIAFAAGKIGPGEKTFGVYAVDIVGGPAVEVTLEKWNYIRDVLWLSDGDTILITAQTTNNALRQMWRVSISNGNATKITETPENLSYISTTKDVSRILISENALSSRLYVVPLGDSDSSRLIAPAYLGVSWASDGSLVYSASNGNDDIWRISLDGSNQQQLTTHKSMDFGPIASPDGNYIVFLSDRAGKLNLWRMNTDGTGQSQLTYGDGEGDPSFSPDGNYVFYSPVGTDKLWKVPITGGEPSQMSIDNVSKMAFSPDGSLFAHFAGKELNKKIVLSSQASREVMREFDLPAGYFAGHELIWSRDGRTVNYIAGSKSTGSNLWSQPVDGSPPHQLTNFSSEGIFFFDFSPDGSKIAVIRGSWSYQIVVATMPQM